MNKTLTHKEIQALPDGSHAIGGVKGLYVRKRAEQTQYFLRWKKDGKQQTRFYAIGLSLREVREIAYRDRQLLNLGLDPKEEEKKAQAAKEAEIEAKRKEEERRRFTFRLVSDEWLKEQIQIQRWKTMSPERNTRGKDLTNTFCRPSEISSYPKLPLKTLSYSFLRCGQPRAAQQINFTTF